MRELDQLATLFDEVVHVASFHKGNPPPGFIPYVNDRIRYVPIKPSGGKSLLKKIGVVLRAPINLFILSQQVRKADWIHLRLPANLGVYVLPFLYVLGRRNVWVKYAGNWNHPNPPVSYRFQRWFLIKNFLKSKVTINGKWPGQLVHIISFENPCFSEHDCMMADKESVNKRFDGDVTICFVGTLNPGKGVVKLIHALKKYNSIDGIAKLIVVGDGPELENARIASADLSIPTEFTGYLGYTEIRNVYRQAHIIVLPSESEGFPKVIAEAASFRCVPVVSDVSSLSQYIFHMENGFLLAETTVEAIREAIEYLLANRIRLKSLADEVQKISEKFTYERYCNRVTKEILQQCT